MNRLRYTTAFCVFFLLSSTFAVAPAASSPQHPREPMEFPLDQGSCWEYDVELVQGSGPPKTFKATKTVRGEKEVGGRRYVRLVTDTTGGGMRIPDQLYRVCEQGVCAAVQGAEGKELLVLPANPRHGQSWRGEAEPAIIELSAETTLGETFAYEGSHFPGCVRVSLSMTVVERSFFGGEKKVPVRFIRWFAPGTGMVRELRIAGEEGAPGYLRTDSKLTKYRSGRSTADHEKVQH